VRSPEDRRQRLLAIVTERGTVSLRDLADALSVSLVTIRRDAEHLNSAGLLVRQHGTVTSPEHLARQQGPDDSSPYVVMTVGAPSPYLSPVAQAARRRAYELGLRFVLHLVSDDQAVEVISRFQDDPDCVGVLLAPNWSWNETLPRSSELLDSSGPVVLVERAVAHEHPLAAMDQVSCDHGYGVFVALDHLRDLGHERIALVARDDSPTARAIRAAYTDIIGSDESWTRIWTSPGNEQPDAYRTLEEFVDFAREQAVTAVLAHNDWTGLQIHQALQSRRGAAPADLSIIAYDDVVAELSTTALTAVAPPTREIGRTAVDTVWRRIRHEDGATTVRHVRLMPRLAVRGSTGSPQR